MKSGERFLTVVVLILVLISTMLVGCSASSSPAPATSAPAKPTALQSKEEQKEAPKAATAESKPAAKAPADAGDSTAKYDALVQAAKKEGKLVLSSMEVVVREGLVPTFGKKYGIDIEYLHLNPTDLVNRLTTERHAGQYNVDAVIQGPGTFILNMFSEGMVDPMDDVFVLPEVTDPSKWLDGQLPWNDPQHRVFRLNKYVGRDVTINNILVQKDDMRVYKDLLNPKWKGKIAAEDPTVLGPGGVVASYLMVSFGEDFIKQLYIDQDVALSRDTRQLADWVGHGRYPILVWGSNAAIIEGMKKDGLPVESIRLEDLSRVDAGWGALALMNRAPHPNAAKLFANWLASKEGMEEWAKISSWPVTRVDADQSTVPDVLKLTPDMHYLDTASYDYLTTKRTPAQNKVRELVVR